MLVQLPYPMQGQSLPVGYLAPATLPSAGCASIARRVVIAPQPCSTVYSPGRGTRSLRIQTVQHVPGTVAPVFYAQRCPVLVATPRLTTVRTVVEPSPRQHQ